jgi:hypothetical protein
MKSRVARVLGWGTESQAGVWRGQNHVHATKLLIEGKQVLGHARRGFTS